MITDKSCIVPLPQFFDRYIDVVSEPDLLVALKNSLDEWMKMDWKLLSQIGDKVYQPGKWTIKEILQHINDNERIQSYRALCFARNDQTPLPGYDEDLYVSSSNAGVRSLDELKEEFYFLRMSVINMYNSFGEEQLQRHGVCFNIDISVLALGFVLVGHQMHHMKVMQERYFYLADIE